jgi:prepilin-type processing-associated H-X9-DG protein
MRSIVQTVLVILVLLILVGGFLLPTVSKVRDAARRAECRNNLRQLGLSLRDYGDTFNRFPAAAMPNPNLPPEERLSWVVAIAPFVEASPLYNKMAKDKSWQADENRFAALLQYRILLCPAYPEGPPVSTLSPTHYVGIAGVGSNAAELPLTDPRAGFFGYDRQLTLKDAGQTSTLLVAAETGRAEGSWIAAGPATVRGLEPDGLPYLGADGQFGGLHRQGTNAVFADGSVRFIPNATGRDVLEALAVLRGRENLGPLGGEY